MKLVKSVLLSAALLAAVAPGISEARGGHGGHGGHYGFGWGLGLGALIAAPFVAAAYYSPPYYAPYAYAPPYAPAPVVYSQPAYSQPVYAQQPAYAQPMQAQQAVQPWYFCAASNGYYPYVRQCPGGWQQVSPTPPGM